MNPRKRGVVPLPTPPALARSPDCGCRADRVGAVVGASSQAPVSGARLFHRAVFPIGVTSTPRVCFINGYPNGLDG